MLHSWRGYEGHAWGRDELCPVSLAGKDSFGGLGATMIDAMDTLHMMGEWIPDMQAHWHAAGKLARPCLNILQRSF